MLKKADRIYFGGDYNPDQWDEATILEDMRLFEEAGINLLTLPVFSWAKLEPAEGEYHFEWLDRILDIIWSHGIRVCLATPTTAQPAWLSKKYPEVLPVDIAGRRRTHGMRVFFCVNSPKYRERAAAIAEEMARRYARHPALAVWHVSNEYGTYCYCPVCQDKFRGWLKKRYGSIEELNARWHTAFWGRTVYDFDEIMLPTELNDDYRFQPNVELDYLRFMTDSTAECFRNEADILKKYNPDIPVSTNISGFIKKLDQFEMLKHMDVAGWDNYPWPTDPPDLVAFKHDIMRGLKGGQSYMMTEQSPNQQNWQPYNKLKRPGEVRKISYQAIAHGADTCLFFQMRQSIAGQEKFHGAVISHAGHGSTRVFREVKHLGAELKKLGSDLIGGRISSRVGILFDWNNWWALELASGPSKDMDYLKTVSKYYKAFYERNIPVDILPVDCDLDSYDLILAPELYMTKEGVAERITEFVRKGGTFAATVMSGLVDENDRCVFGEYPGKLKEVLGIWVEETDALRPEEFNYMLTDARAGLPASRYRCGFLCDIVHPRKAETMAVYESDFYRGVPCLTRNSFGKGTAWYIGTEPEDAFLSDFFGSVCSSLGIRPLYPAAAGVELTNRVSGQASVVFALNHNVSEAWVDFGSDQLTDYQSGKTLTGMVKLAPWDVLVLKKKERN